MTYRVIPFNAQIRAGEGADRAAAQLEALVNDMRVKGWEFRGLEAIDTVVVTPAVPGNNGCLGLGAVPGTPELRNNVAAYVAVFKKKS